MVSPLKVLFFDVETSWMVVKTHSPRVDYISSHQVVHRRFLHCWAAQWRGEKQVLSDRQTPEEAQAKDDLRITVSLAELVRQADAVVAHNGDKFDIPKLRNRLIISGQEPLGPVQSIDTLKVARQLGFDHNNLDSLAQELLGERKMDTPKGLWDDAYEGNDLALQRMTRYCKKDVVLLAQVFDKLLPHATSTLRLVDAMGEVCPHCGSTRFHRRGTKRTQAASYAQFQCQDCLRYFRARTAEPTNKTNHQPL